MHGSKETVSAYVQTLAEQPLAANVTVVLIPPVGYLQTLGAQLAGTPHARRLELGAQDLHTEVSGAFTGETAGTMIRDLGGLWALVGHSERRQYAGETDKLVARKFAAALSAGLTPVLCVGESAAERDSAQAEAVVRRQLNAVVSEVGAADLGRGVVAYEPVWAIGTGKTATAAMAQAMHGVIRAELAGLSQEIADAVPLLYGGSVKAGNAPELFAEPDIDGGLIGGAALDAREFAAIVAAAGA